MLLVFPKALGYHLVKGSLNRSLNCQITSTLYRSQISHPRDESRWHNMHHLKGPSRTLPDSALCSPPVSMGGDQRLYCFPEEPTDCISSGQWKCIIKELEISP